LAELLILAQVLGYNRQTFEAEGFEQVEEKYAVDRTRL
jgi:hypothetical protein